jgi:ankyrin repeat protein
LPAFELPLFEGAELADVNACAVDGDNALHVVVRWGDRAAAEALIDAGIDINKAGDLGYSPLHVACMSADLEMVKVLVENGANLFFLSEGYPPFTSARLAGKDEICDFLSPLMKEAQERDPRIRLKSRIAQLRRELVDLEAELDIS